MIPVRVESSPCEGCVAPCCVDRMVIVGANELWRLCRTMSLPWKDVATAGVAFGDGVRLDGGPTRWAFRLRQRRAGACIFLVQPEGAHARCGVHGFRPAACRLYPYHIDQYPDGLRVELGGNAACPPELAAAWRKRVPDERDAIYHELGERALYHQALARWDAVLARYGQAVDADTFVRWSFLLYDKIEPLRGAGERWRDLAAVEIANFAVVLE